jgi:tRNA-Thr(GGU) m(6)t(6)A37 methyltransferase TsaA
MDQPVFQVHPVGRVESPLVKRDLAPRQGDEGAPDAWLVFEPAARQGIADFTVGTELIVLTWLDRAQRDVLAVHPRGDENKPLRGVFSTRSPDRPNPIGLHTVQVIEIDELRIRVRNLEALDGTPIVDVKPILEPLGER